MTYPLGPKDAGGPGSDQQAGAFPVLARVGGLEPASRGTGRGAGDRGRLELKAMNESDRFAQADQQVSILKDRIARQREAVKQAKLRGHAVAQAEAAQQALEQTLRAFEKHRQQVFERLEAKQQ